MAVIQRYYDCFLRQRFIFDNIRNKLIKMHYAISFGHISDVLLKITGADCLCKPFVSLGANTMIGEYGYLRVSYFPSCKAIDI